MQPCLNCGNFPREGALACDRCGHPLSQVLPAQAYYQPQPQPQKIGIGTGMKLAIGGCLGVVLLMGACTVFFGVIGRNALDAAKKQDEIVFSPSGGQSGRTSAGGRLVAVNKTVDFQGLKLTIQGVEVRPDRLMISMLLVNTTAQKFTVYPSQGNATIGTMQLDCNVFLGDGDLSGDIQAGVEKRGGLTFMVPSGQKLDPDSVSTIKLDLGTIYDQRYKTQQMGLTVAL
jgi:hypothetical protein